MEDEEEEEKEYSAGPWESLLNTPLILESTH